MKKTNFFYIYQNRKKAHKISQNVNTKGAVNHPPTNWNITNFCDGPLFRVAFEIKSTKLQHTAVTSNNIHSACCQVIVLLCYVLNTKHGVELNYLF